MPGRYTPSHALQEALAAVAVLLLALLIPAALAAQTPLLPRFLDEVEPGSMVEGADNFGPLRDDIPAAPVRAGSETLGWAFITSDFVGTTGYSGKPIHVMVAVDADARVTGVQLVHHSEPIVLIGIPESRIAALTAEYAGLDLIAEAEAGGSAHDLHIISGATVTIMVIDDSIVRSGLRVARALGLGGLAPPPAPEGPRYAIDPDAEAPEAWFDLLGEGSVRRMSLDTGQVNAAFEQVDDPRAARRPIEGPAEELFIDLYSGLISVPGIGRRLLGDAEYGNLENWLDTGENAILVAGRGPYSFKGSGYVRGGIFDRIQLIQGDMSVRFHDHQHRRLGAIAADGAPTLSEIDMFRIPADSGFDPTRPWRLQLLVQRDVAAIERVFTTFNLQYETPARYLEEIAPPPRAGDTGGIDADEERAAQAALWQRIWRDKTWEIGGLVIMLTVLTGAFFFQNFLTRSAAVTFWFRMSFLSVTLVFLGWYANAQLSVVNLMALTQSLVEGFSWQAFLLDPLTFILWFSVAAALIFWGRGAYCGWLCPFGALQELTNRIARWFRVPQWTLPWGLHERLWPIKYIIFLGLFGVTLVSLEQAEKLAEVEPFKTAIVLNFARAWPFVLYVVVLLGIGLFVERFYCRYLCPLGAALAIPARIRMFDWLKRYRECGNPCQTCAHECPVQAIHPTGEINPNECVNCMNCQVLYQSKSKCPVVIRQLKRREAVSGRKQVPASALERARKTPEAKVRELAEGNSERERTKGENQ